ncbi:protein kinase [Luteolibacter flavescens]|uniref:Protein kinase n=1 Tax=Luteolibacter flavescens TaxID=1859460 RepID=A0ABT3FNQ3_9BACT|nr:serine/threonine-protein kinase [Luteolibacter flavescens]MCW1885208.1 protein kinase [Luteolibacter flavescens]
MEERYEIRGKLGQGGLGAVYRAWDHALKREVAVKRIVSGDDDVHRDEATKQMEKETGALAALQHPNIVTIYDVGSDEDGPFVVMELLTGQTLDEIVEKAPLTWPDFRELVLQIQEALVAAQHLGLVHRDLKPSNIMVNWLPSGRFQTKIVDFGLAKFSPKTSIDTIEQGDIFGSIFYMAPEQFERAPIDSRLDMYSIGCVYYFTLTGQNPFQGETAHQVMAAHLEHRVIPLGEVRPDIPKWAADWVMWHINRYPVERPENARESMKSFIQLDQPISQAIVQPVVPAGPPAALRPRMASGAPQRPTPVPTAMVATQAVKTHTAPQPLAPPDGAPPSLHSGATDPDPEPEPEEVPAGPPPPDIPPPPSPVAVTGPVTTVRRAPGAGVPGPTIQFSMPAKKKGMSEGQRNMLAVLGGLLLLVIIYFFVTQFS